MWPISCVPCQDHILGLLQGVIPEQDLNTLLTSKHRPNYCLRVMGELFNQCSYLSENEFVRLDTQMTMFADYLGAMERIFKSPIPLPYTRCVLGPDLQRADSVLQGFSPEYLGVLCHCSLLAHMPRSLSVMRRSAITTLLCLTSCMPSPELHSPLCALVLGLQGDPDQQHAPLPPCSPHGSAVSSAAHVAVYDWC